MIAAQEKPDYGYSGLPAYEVPAAPRVRVPSKRRTRMVLTALILSCFALGIAYVLVNAFTTNAGYRLENLKHRVAVMEAENQSLEMRISKQDTLRRIETRAVVDLGMVVPTDENTLMVAIAEPAVRQPEDPVSPTAAVAAAEDGVPEEAGADETDPSLLEVLLGFICGREPGARAAQAG